MNVPSSLRHSILAVIALAALAPQTAASQGGENWESVPQTVRDRKAFKRFEWFYRQRAMPTTAIPEGALEAARTAEIAREALRPPGELMLDLTWSNIGPAGVVSTWPSQWGVVSGRVRALAVHPTDPNTVYIGPAAGGIWKTTNAGVTWQDVGVNLASLTFGAIAIDPNNPLNVYAGAGESIRYFNTTTYSGKGLYKSTDAGATWTQVTSGFATTTHFGALKVSPTNSNTVFAALGSGYYYGTTSNEGLWRSTNAGITWTRTLNVDDGFDVLPHPSTANRVYGATGGGVSTSGFYRSTDNGASWTQITTGLPTSTSIQRMQIALATSTPSAIYALIYTSSGTATVYRSTNDGTNWSAVSSSISTAQGWYDLTLCVNPTNLGEVYIGMEELWRSTDSARTFNYVGGSYWSQAMHVDFHIMGFAPSNSNYRYVGCDGGIYRSTDGGLNWGQLNSALPTLQYYRIGSHPTDQNTVTGGSQDNGVFRTTNGGVGNWSLVSTGDGMECFYDYSSPSTVYASTQYGAIVKSTTGGGYGTFASIQPTTGDNWAWTAPFFIHPTASNTLYTASQRPWRSTDGGGTWVDLNGGLLTTYTINTMAQSRVNANNMILAASEGSTSWPATPPVYVSTNGGTSWTNVTANIGGSARYITRVLFHPTNGNTCFVVRSGFSSGNKIYRSTNMGTAWTNISGDLPDVPHNDLFIDPATPAEMYTANDLGVYRTTNGGTSWTRQGNGMPYVPAIDFDSFISGGVRLLRAATHGRSAYQASLGATQSVTVSVPNGGEVWRIGTTQNIQWTSLGLTGNVAIDLSRNGGATYESIQSSTPDDGLEPWTVAGIPTPGAIIRVSSVSSPAIRDSSNGTFFIIQPTVTVVAPNGGETWTTGMLGMIQWTSVNLSGNVRVELSRNGGVSFDTLFVATPDDGMEPWPVLGPATTQALVRITSVDIPSVADVSDNSFSIVQPTITMIMPNGGENWAVGSNHTIQWSSSIPGGTVRIRLSRDGGITFPALLFSGSPNDGLEPWTVTGSSTTAARIRVISEGDTTVAGVSAADFTIFQPSITVITPNGGESWPAGSTQMIQWSSVGLGGTVAIRLSRDGGTTFPEALFSGLANDGSEQWTVTGPATGTARVRVLSESDTTVAGASAADFSIAQASLTLISPNGGEVWPIESVRTILWSSSLVTGNVCLELSRNGGWSFDTLAASTPNDGTEGWTVTGPATGTARVRVTSINDPTLSVVSASDFSIAGLTSIAGGVIDGWNMLSVPVTVPDLRATQVFPGAASYAYAFTSTGYQARDTLRYGEGYWLDYDSAQTFTVAGGTRGSDTIVVAAGWNMIGSISVDVPVDSIVQIPPGFVVSPFFVFNGSAYVQADTVNPMRSFWVKVSQAGQLVLGRGSGRLRPAARPAAK